jgi:hypothetical protein
VTQAIRHARADERESDAALTDEPVAAQAALDYHPALVRSPTNSSIALGA